MSDRFEAYFRPQIHPHNRYCMAAIRDVARGGAEGAAVLPYYKDNKSDNLELLNVLYNVNMV